MGSEIIRIGENKNNVVGFTGTEFNYPILYAIKGVDDPASLREEDMQPVHGRQHIDYLWMMELTEAMEQDRDRYFISDDSFRELCVGLNEGSNGWALLVGLDEKSTLGDLTAELSSRKLKPFTYGETADMMRKANIQFTDLGPRESGAIYFAQLLVRYALIYARDLGGNPHEISHSIEEYAPGVVLLLGEPDVKTRSILQGLLGLGVPVVSLQKDYGLIGHKHRVQTVAKMMDRVWRLPNIRARLVERASVVLPVPSGPVYGRGALNEDMVAFRVGGSGSGFIVSMPSNIEEATVNIVGTLDDASGFSVLVELGNPEVEPDLTLWVDAVIQKVSKYAKGVKIQSSGGGVELLMTQEALDAEFTLNHLGNMIITELKNEFPSIGPVKVSFILDASEEERLKVEVDKYKEERRSLIDSASEDSLDTFYGCTRCRSFSLGHACTVTPDRPAQCSKPWYMLKAYAVLAPGNTYNPCTLIEKGDCLDPVRGEYTGVNASTGIRTEGRVERVFLHSIFEYPHTACSCFQNIAYYIPEVDGIAIMDRGFKGKSPGDWTWTKLANLVAGGQYQNGAASIATGYLRSPKFLQADGGYSRVVWMSEKLLYFSKDMIPEKHLQHIGTEKDARSLVELRGFLEKGHSKN